MAVSIQAFAAAVMATLVSATAQAQTTPATPDEAGMRDMVIEKCAQCHTDAMWRDQRQNARAWEATTYRMVARGGIWTTDEIKAMSIFLAQNFGPDTPRAKAATR